MNPEDWVIVSNLPGNSNCVDCNAKYPEWGSVNFGILFCTRCCSSHRSLGTHISPVRSVGMDAWTEKQVKLMKVGGNNACKDWFLSKGKSMEDTTMLTKAKYDNEIAKLYTEVLKARVAGRHEPKSPKEAKSLKRWGKPKELLNKWYKNDSEDIQNLASSLNRERKTVVQRIRSVYCTSDFWLFVYLVSLVGWAAVSVVVNYR